MTHDFEGHIRNTLASGGAQVTVLRQGYLLKRGSGMRREWKRRYFVLDSQGMLYYYSAKVCRPLPTAWGLYSAKRYWQAIMYLSHQ